MANITVQASLALHPKLQNVLIYESKLLYRCNQCIHSASVESLATL